MMESTVKMRCPSCKWIFLVEKVNLRYSPFEKKYWVNCPNKKCKKHWNRVYLLA